MMDTGWFEEKSDDEKLTYLSKLMYSDHQLGAKAEFLHLLKLLPVQLVFLSLKNSNLHIYRCGCVLTFDNNQKNCGFGAQGHPLFSAVFSATASFRELYCD